MANHTVSHSKTLDLFNFNHHEIRAITDDQGFPWFVAKDVFAVLEISWRGAESLERIKPDWKRCTEFPNTLGGTQETFFINEPAVYKIAFRSNKDEAERFTDWLAEEVLPSIRKTGEYRLLLKTLLREEPASWERRFPDEYYQPLCHLFGWKYAGHRPLPNVIGQITERWVYEPLMPREVIAEMRGRRNKRDKLHQWLTDKGAKSIIRQIEAVSLIARQSTDYRDFDARCITLWGKQGQQLSLLFPMNPLLTHGKGELIDA